jgi:hypothetical protein
MPKILAPHENSGGCLKFWRMPKILAGVQNIGGCPKCWLLQKIRRPYCLGSAESPAADFLLVWLESSRSDPRRCVDSQKCRPQVPCLCPVMAFIQTSDQSGAGIAASTGFPCAGGAGAGGWGGGGREGGSLILWNQVTSASYKIEGGGRVAITRVQGV